MHDDRRKKVLVLSLVVVLVVFVVLSRIELHKLLFRVGTALYLYLTLKSGVH